MTADSVERSLAAVQAWLAGEDEPESVIAAHEAEVAESQDEASRWLRRLLDEQRPDGSWDGDLRLTAQRLLTIAELRAAAKLREQPPEVGLGLEWLRSRQGEPGAWTDGCSEERHRRGLCHHFMGGFFSPGPPEVIEEEAWLRSGAGLFGDAENRFAASALALRCLLEWETGAGDVQLHLEGLRRVVGGWEEHVPAGLSTTALLMAVHALLRSGSAENAAAAGRGLRLVAGKQRGDGSWVDTDAFHSLEVFDAAVDAAVAAEQSLQALWHGARLLISTQHTDGSWGRDHGPRRALIAWRTFRRVDPVR